MQPGRILVPYDSSGPSRRACDYAVELASALGATLCMMHVVEQADMSLPSLERAILDTRAELERALERLRPYIRHVETVVATGSRVDQIERVARRLHADLIVLGTHGRRGFARMLFGSVAAEILRTATVPVTTIPEYVAVSRSAAGERLADALEGRGFEQANVIGLSRGALPVAASLASKLEGTVDLWAVQKVVTREHVVIGAIGEDEAIELDRAASTVSITSFEEAVARARARLRSELNALKGARSIGDCWKRDIVIVADGLFSPAYARVALDELRKLAPRKIAVVSPMISREVEDELDTEVDALVALERSVVSEVCVYRDDVIPSNDVAYQLLLAPCGEQRRASV
jgi:predicted phosphoribosyltransferase/nucleotide-binding universal stress UspA family protein